MSWKSLIDKALGTDFDKPRYDPTVGRNKLIRQIDLAAKQHTNGTTRAPNRAWAAGGTEDNPSVRFEAKIDGKPVLLDGDKQVFVPASRFQDFLTHLKSAVEAGELDKEIRTALESSKPAGTTSTNRPASKRSGSKPWEARDGYADLPRSTKQVLAGNHRVGLNPDRSPFKEGEYNPNASPIRNKDNKEV